jgi:hypothetical protein
MYIQELLEVAIGLIFAWLLLSIATLQVQELISSLLAKRATDLEIVIGEMLGDPQKAREFYEHPLIKSLSEPLDEKKKALIRELESKKNRSRYDEWRLRLARARPSYIPARNFSVVLFDIVTKAGTNQSPIQKTLNRMRLTIMKLPPAEAESARLILDRIYKLGQLAADEKSDPQFQKGVITELRRQIDLLEKMQAELKPCVDHLRELIQSNQDNLGEVFQKDDYLQMVRNGSTALSSKSSELTRALNSLLAGVEQYVTDTDSALGIGRKNVEQWFDSVMARMNGWYKRWAQTGAFFISLALAILINIDSVRIANELWTHPALREASAAYIEGVVDKQIADETKPENLDLKPIKAELELIAFPIGWKGDVPENTWGWLVKGFGILTTAGAAMLGAPFWFDILKNLVNLRRTGINPAENKDEQNNPTEA